MEPLVGHRELEKLDPIVLVPASVYNLVYLLVEVAMPNHLVCRPLERLVNEGSINMDVPSDNDRLHTSHVRQKGCLLGLHLLFRDTFYFLSRKSNPLFPLIFFCN